MRQGGRESRDRQREGAGEREKDIYISKNIAKNILHLILLWRFGDVNVKAGLHAA